MIRKIFHDTGYHSGTLESRHEFLVRAPGVDGAFTSVTRFLDAYQLVRYRRIDLLRDRCLVAGNPGFIERLDQAVEENRRRIRGFLAELQSEGFDSVAALEGMTQGHSSKTLHTAAHLLDGFFGIDSFFFNLAEDSHELSEGLRARLEIEKGTYILAAVLAVV